MMEITELYAISPNNFGDLTGFGDFELIRQRGVGLFRYLLIRTS